MTQTTITIVIKLFAAYQEAYGVPELRLSVPDGTSVADIRDRLLAEHPDLEKWRDVTQFGVNLEFVAPNTILAEGDEVVLIPPVSGG